MKVQTHFFQLRFVPIAAALLASSSAVMAQGALSWKEAGNSTLGGNGTWDLVGTNWWNGSAVTSNLAGLSFTNSSGIWSGTELTSRTWAFTEDTGVHQVVPEPTTWALLGLGLGATFLFRRRKD